MEATISADVVKSTSLSEKGMVILQNRLKAFVRFLETNFSGSWGRIVRGDGIECVIADSRWLLRVVLLLKCYIKAIRVDLGNNGIVGGNRNFYRFGIRMAVAIGTLRTNNRSKGIIDGEAIYNSGRALAEMRIKDTFSIICVDKDREPVIRVIFLLIDSIMTRATARQCQVMFMRLQNISESEIARQMGISRIAVYLHLKSLGWESISEALRFYECINY